MRVTDGAAEVEAGVALVYELEAAHLDEGAGLGAAAQHSRHHLPQQLLLGLSNIGVFRLDTINTIYLLRMCLIPLLQPWLGLLAEECDELDHGCVIITVNMLLFTCCKCSVFTIHEAQQFDGR